MTIDITSSPLSEVEARRLTERIKATLDTTARGLDRLAAQVAEAYERRADLALGYGSWSEYAGAEFGEETRGLSAPIRRQLVGYLSAEGMSTRAIAPAVGVSVGQAHADIHSGVQQLNTSPAPAPAVGVSHMTAVRDVREVKHDVSPAPAPASSSGATATETQHVDMATGEILNDSQVWDEDDREGLDPLDDPDPAPEPRRVTGLDGKAYSVPQREPATPRRPALTEQIFNAVYDLGRKAERLEALTQDDRFPQNKEKAAAKNRSDLLRTIDTLQRVADRLA